MSVQLPDVTQMNYIVGMKTATIPSVRIEPSFREDMEQALGPGESLAALVEKAVRNELARRHAHTEFVRRGMAAIDRTVAMEDGMPADAVVNRLRASLAAARAGAAR